MPHRHSPVAGAARRDRARRRGYLQPGRPGSTYIEVPSMIACRARAVARSLAAHDQHCELSGHAHHFAASAALAVRPIIGTADFKKSMDVHKTANAAKHVWCIAGPPAPAAGPAALRTALRDSLVLVDRLTTPLSPIFRRLVEVPDPVAAPAQVPERAALRPHLTFCAKLTTPATPAPSSDYAASPPGEFESARQDHLPSPDDAVCAAKILRKQEKKRKLLRDAGLHYCVFCRIGDPSEVGSDCSYCGAYASKRAAASEAYEWEGTSWPLAWMHSCCQKNPCICPRRSP